MATELLAIVFYFSEVVLFLGLVVAGGGVGVGGYCVVRLACILQNQKMLFYLIADPRWSFTN